MLHIPLAFKDPSLEYQDYEKVSFNERFLVRPHLYIFYHRRKTCHKYYKFGRLTATYLPANPL